jgi:hypothetical protein
LQTSQAIIQARICHHDSDESWRSIIGYDPFGVKTEDADIVLTVHNNKFVGAELHDSYRGGSWGIEGDADSFLAIDIDLPWTKFGLVGADSKEGLDRIIGHDGDLGIDSIAGKLSAS